MKNSILITVFFSMVLSACGVREARVSGNPPTLQKVFFKSGALSGQFVSEGAAKVFLWPTEDKSGKELSMEKQILKRTEIFKKAEIQAVTETRVKKEIEILLKSTQLEVEKLTDTFVDQQCGLLASDLFGDPDSGATSVDEWKDPDNEEESLAIESCQANMDEREQLLQEAERKPEQLKEEALAATLELVNSIGSENFFNGIGGLTVGLEDPFAVELIKFEGKTFTNVSKDPGLQVTDVLLNKEEGLVSFSIPAYSKEDPSRLVGKYVFDFEVATGNPLARLDGEIRLILNSGKVKTGRATFEGTLGSN